MGGNARLERFSIVCLLFKSVKSPTREPFQLQLRALERCVPMLLLVMVDVLLREITPHGTVFVAALYHDASNFVALFGLRRLQGRRELGSFVFNVAVKLILASF